MAVVIVVEDGSQIENANSYVTLDEANEYVANIGGDSSWDSLTDDNKNIRIYQAQRYLHQKYASKFVGSVSSTTQPLDWPRGNGYTRNGVELDDSSIPIEVKDSQIELALLWSRGSNVLYPSGSNNVKKVYKKLSVMTTETEYFSPSVNGEINTTLNLSLANVLKSNQGFVFRV